jgi:O-antigen ligase
VWVSVISFFIVGSRLPSQWVGLQGGLQATAMEEGNSLDRIVLSGLILVALCILISRSLNWGKLLTQNIALAILLIYSLLSVLWSDFPSIAFKRWFRDLAYLAILVVLTDPYPMGAVFTLLRRLGFLLIPLSVILIKYYPEIGKAYDMWTGQAMFSGATTSKNMLGVLCLVSGLYFFWDTLIRWGERKEKRTRQIIGVNLALFAMTLWLLDKCDSQTSTVCLILGCGVIIFAHTKAARRSPALLAIIPVGICLYLMLEFAFGINLIAVVAEAVGRNPDLTGRTHIWQVVLGTNTNPLIGAGYESFWLGPRLEWIWERTGRINQAHNGYLEVYLTLGSIGVFILIIFLIVSYLKIVRSVKASAGLGSLGLALWTVLLFYNVTEAAFRGHLMWIVFLLGAVVVPDRSEQTKRIDPRLRDPIRQLPFKIRPHSR